MRTFDQLTWDDFRKDIQGKELYLWGAGLQAECFLQMYGTEYEIVAIVDNDACKWGKVQQGLEIISPENLLVKNKEEIVILLTGLSVVEISAQAGKLGFHRVYSWYIMRGNDGVREEIPANAKKRLLSILNDNASKTVVEEICRKRENGLCDYSDIYTEKQYIPVDIIEKDEREIIIDGGACRGETVKLFMDWNAGVEKIYAFEPFGEIFGELKSGVEVHGKTVECVNAGLWNEKAVMAISDDSVGSTKIVENGVAQVQLVSLDEYISDNEKVTFIKMDIEGSELNALKGAKMMIGRCKPKLAICIYHKPEDLWEIPIWVHENFPEYKLYIRHHHISKGETVLYAI